MTAGEPTEAAVQVTAFSTPTNPAWRWRIVNYAGETIAESRNGFQTIAAAITHGTKHLVQMNVVDRSEPAPYHRGTSHLRGR
jgi:hypothetical protein